mmetsp:Transcript_16141/g.29028  ORF Transcript_16141/g.29028 Transcript_16141/m.29028 type:complete len:95 (+) Transcript_16141:108-392(+)|eukprot:CAMPEP_0197529690 /NCGR_PEP_ID=MMETSP1318-20131121/29300_1 /TAXON_ID=552666 /ORGANISM="Partenskyella glossopodia, Strain RCC365" /LENGTH=94 /DNA_ID=CAMNT_0043085257 /DNA_START=68 /DNA_END=352 /DNA_ORIENTATION=-
MGRRKGIKGLMNLNKKAVSDVLEKASGTGGGPGGVCVREAMALTLCMETATDAMSQCRMQRMALQRCSKTAAQEKRLRKGVRKNLIFQILTKRF